MRKLLVLGFLLAACGGKKASNDPPPPQPSHGAPIAFEAKSFKAGSDRGGSVDVKAYNFSDKKVGQYMLLFRYKDASGAAVKVKAGTPFEKEHDFMSLSGNRYSCAPKSWCGFTIKNLDVPDKTAKVEVVATSVTAVASDGVKFEDKPLFESSGMDWPGEKPVDKPIEKAPEAESGGGSAAPGSAAPAPEGSGSAAGRN
jgi:hypothetical protein